MRYSLILAAAGMSGIVFGAQAQTNPGEPSSVTQQPADNASTPDEMTPNTPTVTQRHKQHAAKPAKTPAAVKHPTPPDQKPSPPPDQVETTPGTNVPVKEPARPMPGEEPTPQSQQNPPPPPH